MDKNAKLKQLYRKLLPRQQSSGTERAGGAKPPSTVAVNERPPSGAEKSGGAKPPSTLTGAEARLPVGIAAKTPHSKERMKHQKDVPIQRKVAIEKAKTVEEENKEEFEVVKGARPAICNPLEKRKSKMRWKNDLDENKEEFEVVAGARPAVCNPLDKRKPKLKWKNMEDTDKDDKGEGEKAELGNTSGTSGNTDTKTDTLETASRETLDITQLRQEIEEAKNTLLKQKDNTVQEQEEIKKITSVFKKLEPIEKPDDGKTAEEPGFDDATLSVATKILEVVKRNQLLEAALNYKESKDLYVFFSSGGGVPITTVATHLEKAMRIAIDMMVNRSHEIEDVIDKEMRPFLMNRISARRTLLEVMLVHPKFVPQSWGGKFITGPNVELKKELQKRAGGGIEVGARRNSKERSTMAGVVPHGSTYHKSAHFTPHR